MLEPMHCKLTDYQRQAFGKPVYICASLLNPRLKSSAITPQTLSVMRCSFHEVKEIFIKHASVFEIDQDIQVIEPMGGTQDVDESD